MQNTILPENTNKNQNNAISEKNYEINLIGFCPKRHINEVQSNQIKWMPRTIHDATISVRVNKVLWYQAMHIVLVLFVHVVDNIKHFIVVIREKTALWLLNSSKIDSEFNLILSSLIGCFLLQCSLGVVVDFSSLSFYRHSLVPF